MFHGLDLGDFREVLWVNDDLRLVSAAEISVDVFLSDLRFVDGAIFPEAVGKICPPPQNPLDFFTKLGYDSSGCKAGTLYI